MLYIFNFRSETNLIYPVMKKLSLLLLGAAMVLSVSCQKEAGVAAPEQPTTKAITKCDADCPYCQHKDGKCTCLFCNCTRYCKTCGNEIYPLNHCVCGSGGGGNTGGGAHDHDCIPCGECRALCRTDCVCNKPALTTYPIEYMDRSKFVGAAPEKTLIAAFNVMALYRKETKELPKHEISGIRITDHSSAIQARMSIDEQLSKFRQPVIVKVRCVSDFKLDNMYDGMEFWIAITGTGGPNTYYTYMELVIENEFFRDEACNIETNRLTVADPSHPVLRDETARYAGGCAYEVIDVLPASTFYN